MVREPAWLLPFFAGAASVGSLLVYFYGLMPMDEAALLLLVPALALVVGQVAWALHRRRAAYLDHLFGSIWAGGIATLAYDAARVPISEAGVPIYKAISYFGTVILGETTPTFASELVGWSYHFSNGVGFGMMYAALVTRVSWWSAVVWGCTLEGLMLLTPYAEVFGYQRSGRFFAITLGSHVIYGLALWLSLERWARRKAGPTARPRQRATIAAGWVAPTLGIAFIAASAHRLHAQRIAPSAPTYLGQHLYTTWNVPELDRLIALWILRTKVDPAARFHFVEPFTALPYGTPFDVPNATVRRLGNLSTTEVLIEQRALAREPGFDALASIAHAFEISPWTIPANPHARGLGTELDAIARTCTDRAALGPCVERVFARLDAWAASRGATDVSR